MSSPVISIIVPVYNASAWLKQCIGSILNQSYEHYELLLIDDGSKDDSLQICQTFAQQDSRIRVIHKENGGVSSARNTGLDSACGRWVVFVDSDDMVTTHYLEGLYKAVSIAPAGKSILGIAGFQSYNVSNGKLLGTTSWPDHVYLDEEVAQGVLEYQLVRRGYPWSKIYDRAVIERLNLRFSLNLSFGEDLIFILHYLRHTDCLIFSSRYDYLYQRNFSGLSSNYSSFENEYLFLSLMREGVAAIVGEECSDPAWLHCYSTMSLRVISCLYRPQTRLQRPDRILALKRYTKEHGIPLSLSSSAKLRLLQTHRYHLFDSLMATLYYLRFSCLKHVWSYWIRMKNRRPAREV